MNQQTRDRIDRMENLIVMINRGGEYSAAMMLRGKYIYICKNNGQFAWCKKDAVLPGFASLIGKYSIIQAENWLCDRCPGGDCNDCDIIPE